MEQTKAAVPWSSIQLEEGVSALFYVRWPCVLMRMDESARKKRMLQLTNKGVLHAGRHLSRAMKGRGWQ